MTEKILIVDDSLTVRMDLLEAFTGQGFGVMACATAAEARAALRREPFALVILDVLLPDGDGVQILEEIRNQPATSSLPILMLSSEAEIKDRIRGLRTGADDYVGKPYDAGHVVARARELVRQRKGEAAERDAVLLIDDSLTFREAVRGMLEGAGYEVVTANTGEEGLRLAALRPPAAIVVDGVMPGISGITLIRKVRLDAALRDTPCLLLTGSEDHDAELRALDAGADAFVRKEEDMQVILARLTAALRVARSLPNDVVSLSAPKRILVVDDTTSSLQELSSVLTDEGYDVVLARSGEEALELLAVQTVDCILMDLLMPGLGGKDTCRQIKASPAIRDIPLILLTAVEERAQVIEGLQAGADDYICKSTGLEVLKARVQAQIRRKQSEDEKRRAREEMLRSELDAAEARAARTLAETRAALVEELERKNKELEAFSYSVSHDLRAPLRSIDGFSQAVLEDYSPQLDARGQDYLRRVRSAAQRMGELIDALLELSRVGRAQLSRDDVDLSGLASSVAAELQRAHPEHHVELAIQPELRVSGDRRLLRGLLENLLGNAWKFTVGVAKPRVEVGLEARAEGRAYFVKDNGAGFNMDYASKLFQPFQRLHSDKEFAGTGIGLATVYRIVERHGGRVWAQGAPGQGATIYFTLSGSRSRGAA